MRRIIFGLTFLFFCCSISFGQQRILIISPETGEANWAEIKGGKQTLTPADIQIIILTSDGSGIPDGPSDPNDPDTPTANADELRAFRLAESIGDKQESAIVAAVYRFFHDQLKSGSIDKSGFEKGFSLSRSIVLSKLSKDRKAQWEDAFEALDNAMGSTSDLTKYLSDVADGMARYSGTSSSSLLEGNLDQPQNIDVVSILSIIEAIIQLLKLLGVLK